MRILTRYILREVTAHALIGVAIFTFVLFTQSLDAFWNWSFATALRFPASLKSFSSPSRSR